MVDGEKIRKNVFVKVPLELEVVLLMFLLMIIRYFAIFLVMFVVL